MYTQQQINEQDNVLDEIGKNADTLKRLSGDIHKELDIHTDLLDETQGDLTGAGDMLKIVNGKVIDQNAKGDRNRLCIICVLICIVIVLVLVLFNVN